MWFHPIHDRNIILEGKNRSTQGAVNSRLSKLKGDLKVLRPHIARGVRRQKGTNPSKARRQILNIFIIHVELKSYVPSVL